MPPISSNSRPNGGDDVLVNLPNSDTEAFNAYYNDHAKGIYRVLYNMVRNTHDAQDLTTDTFLQFWEKRHTIRPDTSVKPLLLTIARNVALNFLRKMKFRGGPEAILNLNDPFDTEAQMMDIDLINYLFSHLNRSEKEVLTLLSQGFTTQEIAHLHNTSVQTVRNQKSNAMNKAKELLGRKDIFIILLLISQATIDSQPFIHPFSIGAQKGQKKVLN